MKMAPADVRSGKCADFDLSPAHTVTVPALNWVTTSIGSLIETWATGGQMGIVRALQNNDQARGICWSHVCLDASVSTRLTRKNEEQAGNWFPVL